MAAATAQQESDAQREAKELARGRAQREAADRRAADERERANAGAQKIATDAMQREAEEVEEARIKEAASQREQLVGLGRRASLLPAELPSMGRVVRFHSKIPGEPSAPALTARDAGADGRVDVCVFFPGSSGVPFMNLPHRSDGLTKGDKGEDIIAHDRWWDWPAKAR